jgi:hypothetical protein
MGKLAVIGVCSASDVEFGGTDNVRLDGESETAVSRHRTCETFEYLGPRKVPFWDPIKD